ncbi:MAG: HDIG domain-containing protein [Pseudomonadota bacterium]|nr:HDIG domain-containing protein [Pseudomonadota bacterium]
MITWKEIAAKLAYEIRRPFARPDLIPAFLMDPVRQRWLILVLLSLALTAMLLPTATVIAPRYKLGAIADKNIKADRDFLVEERAATELKRLEAAQSSRNIFDLDDTVPPRIRDNVMKAFLAIQETARKTAAETTEASRVAAVQKERILVVLEQYLGARLSDQDYATLAGHRFSSEIADRIAEVISLVYQDKLITNVEFSTLEYERGLIVKNVRTRAEREENKVDEILQMHDAKRILRQEVAAAMTEDGEPLKRTVINIGEKLLQPNLTFNRLESEQRRQAAVESVKPVYFEVQKNEMIVREGEKIDIVDLDKLNAFFREQRQQKISRYAGFMGMFFLLLALTTALLFLSRKALGPRDIQPGPNLRLLCLAIIILLQVALIKAAIFLSDAVPQAMPFLSKEAIIFSTPFAVATLLTAYLFSRPIALLMSLLISFLIPFLVSLPAAYLPLFAFLGFVIIICRNDHYRRRSVFIKTGLLLGMSNGAFILAIALLSAHPLSVDTLWKIASGFAGGVMSGIIVAGISPIFETAFDFTTDIKLLELANLNQPIFQRMIMQSPGSYHHSIIVGSMVEAAAEAIGADPILSKVSAYYHDIGKMKKPAYFIENQDRGENRHDKLSPRMSALIIIAHVKDGCDLAADYKLGSRITDIIRQHHGTSLVSYFYEKAKRDKTPSMRSLPESHFRYPGPRPQTREAALVLLGDVVEASSRTLEEPTPARIRNLVRDRIDRVFMDGQLDECPLTLKDLNIIQDSFVRTLNGIFHTRISYYNDATGKNNKLALKSFHEYPDRKPTEKSPRKHPADSQQHGETA